METKKKSFKDLKEELSKVHVDLKYKSEFIRRTFNDRRLLRKTYCSLIISNPARLQDISEKTFNTRQSIYNHLWELKMLGLLDMIPVMDIWNKIKLTDLEKIIIKKFKEWTENMVENQKQYFAAKTRYYVLTDLGKDPEIVEWVLSLEKDERVN